jgi:hypothetical protein
MSDEVWSFVTSDVDAEGIAALVRTFEIGGADKRLPVVHTLDLASQVRINKAVRPPSSRRQAEDLRSRMASERIDRKAFA